jgi:hypothetical protein
LGIKLGLRPYCPTRGPYIQKKRHSLVLTGNKGEPIRGKLKHKESIRIKGTIET